MKLRSSARKTSSQKNSAFFWDDLLLLIQSCWLSMVQIEDSNDFYVSMLFQFGIVGTLLLITVIVLFFRDFIKNNPHKVAKVVFVPMLIIGLLMCVEDLFMFIYA